MSFKKTEKNNNNKLFLGGLQFSDLTGMCSAEQRAPRIPASSLVFGKCGARPSVPGLRWNHPSAQAVSSHCLRSLEESPVPPGDTPNAPTLATRSSMVIFSLFQAKISPASKQTDTSQRVCDVLVLPSFMGWWGPWVAVRFLTYGRTRISPPGPRGLWPRQPHAPRPLECEGLNASCGGQPRTLANRHAGATG